MRPKKSEAVVPASSSRSLSIAAKTMRMRSLSIGPGKIEFTRMPRLPSSLASWCETALSAALGTTYAVRPKYWVREKMVEMLIIEAPGWSTLAAARATFQVTPSRFRTASPAVSVSAEPAARSASRSAREIGTFSSFCLGPAEPALFTMMSSLP